MRFPFWFALLIEVLCRRKFSKSAPRPVCSSAGAAKYQKPFKQKVLISVIVSKRMNFLLYCGHSNLLKINWRIIFDKIPAGIEFLRG
jgi:hypothetical protein